MTKVSALTADTTPTSDDLLLVVNDPGGTPGSRKVTIANFLTSLLVAVKNVQQSYTRSQAVTPVGLTDGATISVDASLSNVFRVVLGGNRTLANPTNLVDGQTLVFLLKQDATGSRTLAYGNKYKFSGSSALSTVASSRDRLTCVYDGTDDLLDCVLTKGFV